MSSLLSSQVAAQASSASGDSTSGALARVSYDSANTMKSGELNSIASGTSFTGGKRKSAKGKSAKKTMWPLYGGKGKRRVRVFTKKGNSYLRKKASRGRR